MNPELLPEGRLSSEDGDLLLKCWGGNDTSSKSKFQKAKKAHNPGWRRDNATWMHQSDSVAKTLVCGRPILLVEFGELLELCKGLGKLLPLSQLFRCPFLLSEVVLPLQECGCLGNSTGESQMLPCSLGNCRLLPFLGHSAQSIK